MIFGVGDNIASDITGANHYGWKSVLVRSGVFKDEGLEDRYALKPNHHIPKDFMELPTFAPSQLEPTILCDDIGEAVEHILRHEGAIMSEEDDQL
jgi:ribonucleotide monophosphatase NagD (HAD superfamily)